MPDIGIEEQANAGRPLDDDWRDPDLRAAVSDTCKWPSFMDRPTVCVPGMT
jgi:hypothetical protein